MADGNDITELLLQWNQGSKRALDELMPMVERELRRLARLRLRDEPSTHTLQPTALVNECYMRLIDRKQVSWAERAHFYGFAARTMRRILVDHARARRTAKRGSGVRAESLDDHVTIAARRDVDVVALDDALKALSALDPRQSRIVELRFFGGLTIQETAEVLEVGEATVSRDWQSARAWLFRELAD